MYADDTAIVASSRDTHVNIKRLNTHLYNINLWTRTWKIKINADKSTHVHFERTRKHAPRESIFFNRTRVPRADEHRFLGVILDKKLTYKPHTNLALAKARQCRFALNGLLSRSSPLNHRSKVRLYASLIRPVLLYGCEIFCNSIGVQKQLEVFQNKALRSMLGLSRLTRLRDVREAHMLPSVRDFISKMARSLAERLRCTDNPLLTSIWDYDELLPTTYPLPKRITRL
jgi:hypothetical protein